MTHNVSLYLSLGSWPTTAISCGGHCSLQCQKHFHLLCRQTTSKKAAIASNFLSIISIKDMASRRDSVAVTNTEKTIKKDGQNDKTQHQQPATQPSFPCYTAIQSFTSSAFAGGSASRLSQCGSDVPGGCGLGGLPAERLGTPLGSYIDRLA